MTRFREDFILRPEFSRACRASLAFLLPLLICHWVGRPSAGIFIAIAAQTIAMPDLRGAYGMRLAILGTSTLVVAFAAVLGVWCGGEMLRAISGVALVALLGGVWRHLSADYGPQLSVASALLFLLGLSHPGSLHDGGRLAGWIVLGGAGTAMLHVTFWLFRPQHPLRHAVAETWMALSDLIAAMRPALDAVAQSPIADLSERERNLRETLDRTFIILGAAENKRRTALLEHLEEMRREVVHLAMRVTGLHAAMEPVQAETEFARHLPALDSVLKAMGDMARSVGFTLVSHRQENFAATEVRIQRCLDLLNVLLGQLPKENWLLLRAALERISLVLPRVTRALAVTIDHGSTARTFPARLPELGTRSIHSVAAWINPAQQIDPVLVRHSCRMAVLMMIGVAIYKGFQIPHGYWIALTMVVVLQPDYGTTRQRAAQRIGGTLAGSVLGSALLWIKMPLLLLDGLAGVMSFCFAYFAKVRYGLAVVFVTLMIVLLTETTGPVHLDFTATRLLCSAFGGALALLSAKIFWPAWEGEKFSTLLAAALRANQRYLGSIATFLTSPPPPAGPLLASKRVAENANRHASASLQRLLTEPNTSEAIADRGKALTTYNQRITRALTAIVVLLEEEAERPRGERFAELIQELDSRLEKLAGGILRAESESFSPVEGGTKFLTKTEPGTPSEHQLASFLAKGIVESQAMALALKGSSTGSTI